MGRAYDCNLLKITFIIQIVPYQYMKKHFRLLEISAQREIPSLLSPKLAELQPHTDGLIHLCVPPLAAIPSPDAVNANLASLLNGTFRKR